jgi:hypothetical protein
LFQETGLSGNLTSSSLNFNNPIIKTRTMRKLNHIPTFLFLLTLLALGGCKKEEYAIPAAGTELSNDCIKRTLGPNIVGLPIEFTYAMALPRASGKLVTAQVEASIAGASGTYLETVLLHNSGGQDVGIIVGSPSVNDGKTTKVSYSLDTMQQPSVISI